MSFTRLHGLLLASAAATLFFATGSSFQAPVEDQRRLDFVPVSSNQFLTDIRESPDGTRLLTIQPNLAPRLWNPRTMNLLRVLKVDDEPIEGALMGKDNKRILTFSKTKIHEWRSLSGTLIKSYSAPEGSAFYRAALSNDGKTIVGGLVDGSIMIFSTESHKLIAHTEPSKNTLELNVVAHLDINSDGTKVLVSRLDQSGAQLVSLTDGKLIWQLGGLEKEDVPLWSFFSKDGKQSITTTYKGRAVVHDLATGKKQFDVAHVINSRGKVGNILTAARFVGTKEEDFLAADENGLMHVYNRASGKEVRVLKGHTASIREIRLSEDGRFLGTYGGDEELKLWDVTTGKEFPYQRPDDSPTAGEFATTGPYFWIGYINGNIRRHNLETGEVDIIRYGSTRTIARFGFSAAEHFYVEPYISDEGLRMRNYIAAINTPASLALTSVVAGTMVPAPAGNRAYVNSDGVSDISNLINATNGQFVMGYKDVVAQTFSADGEFMVTSHKGNNIHLWRTSDGEAVESWNWKDDKEPVISIELNPDNTHVITRGHKDNNIFLWDIRTGNMVKALGPFADEEAEAGFVDGGTHYYVRQLAGIQIYKLSDHSVVRTLEHSATDHYYSKALASRNGKYLALQGRTMAKIWDVTTGDLLYSKEADAPWSHVDLNFSPDSKFSAAWTSNRLWVIDNSTGKPIADRPLNEINMIDWSPKSDRILLSGPDGVDIFNPSLNYLGAYHLLSKQEGTLVEGWLVVDAKGRYDASDPSLAEGATFVLQWSGGLETIEVSQMKSRYYEPGLLAKILGLDPEPARAVPSLDQLRLYPEVKLVPDPAKPGVIDVELYEREKGGIGDIFVFINGKQVATKKGSGIFTVRTADYQSFLLPEARLGGRKNMLQVVAYNGPNDLASPITQIALPTPADLKTPEVKLYGLFVGSGDYVGTGGDLSAPPKDAKTLAAAVSFAGERLLPGRVNVTVLTTGTTPDTRPNRDRIRNWFADVKTKATASDIIFVYFSGHGTHKLGDKTGYFYLTPDCNPGDVDASAIGVSEVSGDDLRSWLAEISANKQIVILDTCHSGAAAGALIGSERSVSGDYARAYESLRDATGTWLLAGSAADQLSYESANVEHGMLTYSLLEAIDKADASGLREGTQGQMFVDVERWLTYAAARVESLKNEVGLKGLQRPEFRRSSASESFDIGVTGTDQRGKIGLRPPKPVVIIGTFDQDEEDPAQLEPAIGKAFADSGKLKAWFEIPKHPLVYRVAGNYTLSGTALTVKVILQKFDDAGNRKTIDTFEVKGSSTDLVRLSAQILLDVERRIAELETPAPKKEPELTRVL